MIVRSLERLLQSRWNSGKVLIVLGPRQVGKTTLLEQLCREQGEFAFFNGDEPDTQIRLSNVNEAQLRRLMSGHHTVFIDEAQRIENIGITLKIIYDRIKDVRLVVSGSSSLELASNINEPLTGRKWEFTLYPVSWQELLQNQSYSKAIQQLEIRLIYGMYPEVVTMAGDEDAVLRQIAGSYLYKDLLGYKGIRKPDMLSKLLTALAFQVGSEVSYNELSNLLRIDRATIENYIDLLEKAFVVFRLQPFSRNLRSEISSSRKIYFYDNGMRNAILNNFSPLALRSDTGALWENFLISERMKANHYGERHVKTYFWRTHAQQEIDYIEEYDGQLYAYEFKWKAGAKVRFPKTFRDSYPQTESRVITPENFDDFLQY